MKALLAVLVLASCGRFEGSDGANGSSCTTRQDSVGVFVECTDGTDSFIPFPDDGQKGDTVVGPAGADGAVGQPGQSCLLVERDITCRHNTKRYKSYLVCLNAEVFIKNVSISRGC